MSTHGCLLVEAHRRRMMLHTYHTGQDIPLLPPLVFDIVAKYHSYMMWRENNRDRDKLLDRLSRTAVFERLEHANSAAALCIAARPCYLEPVGRTRSQLASWSGIDAPWRLKIGGAKWRMYDEDKALVATYDIVDEIVNRLLAIPLEGLDDSE